MTARYVREEGGDLFDSEEKTWLVPIEDRDEGCICRKVGTGEQRWIAAGDIEEATK